MPRFGTSLTEDSRVVIYDRNIFITLATDLWPVLEKEGNRIAREYLFIY